MDPQQFNSEVRRRALEWRAEQEAAFHRKVREGSSYAVRAGGDNSAAQQAAAKPQLPSCTASCQICASWCVAGGMLCCVNTDAPQAPAGSQMHVSALPRHHAML